MPRESPSGICFRWRRSLDARWLCLPCITQAAFAAQPYQGGQSVDDCCNSRSNQLARFGKSGSITSVGVPQDAHCTRLSLEAERVCSVKAISNFLPPHLAHFEMAILMARASARIPQPADSPRYSASARMRPNFRSEKSRRGGSGRNRRSPSPRSFRSRPGRFPWSS